MNSKSEKLRRFTSSTPNSAKPRRASMSSSRRVAAGINLALGAVDLFAMVREVA